ncbi:MULTISPECIES: MoxR family ATPase [unclassified Amycolatopsis]|uniref:AAA family ATPase n=1 Tax=unclassified Amycolatopsis TaxID=2618356 RepID=UPI00287464CE|nr:MULTISPECIES: MoxR family ATPase [unclassified Amycolatopsis]MDS0137277.1 AAA family ATPase [Amycolatopsis sp. 505]MDS0141472.1 AAA family ATPase [Amycolatopsis sp. CM201R]
MNEVKHPESSPDWWIYCGTGQPSGKGSLTGLLPPAPPWREFRGVPLPHEDVVPPDEGEADRRLGSEHRLTVRHVDPHEVDMVNAALYLRRPLLVTGRPGCGKSSLAYRVARELGLGRVLRWPITSHTTLKAGLYHYDAIGRAQAASAQSGAAPGGDREPPIGDYLRLGELGTVFLPRSLPRVLLIDELDKSEADLPNDLLSLFEDGEFAIPELVRMRSRTREVEVFTADPDTTATVEDGRVRCKAFPFVVITSNGDRDFPPAFLRRCLRLEIQDPDIEQLAAMVAAHALDPADAHRSHIIEDFVSRSNAFGGLPVDKLLEAVYLATSGAYREEGDSWERLLNALWRQLNSVVP